MINLDELTKEQLEELKKELQSKYDEENKRAMDSLKDIEYRIEKKLKYK